jgi:hypothetical protein
LSTGQSIILTHRTAPDCDAIVLTDGWGGKEPGENLASSTATAHTGGGVSTTTTAPPADDEVFDT